MQQPQMIISLTLQAKSPEGCKKFLNYLHFKIYLVPAPQVTSLYLVFNFLSFNFSEKKTTSIAIALVLSVLFNNTGQENRSMDSYQLIQQERVCWNYFVTSPKKQRANKCWVKKKQTAP